MLDELASQRLAYAWCHPASCTAAASPTAPVPEILGRYISSLRRSCVTSSSGSRNSNSSLSSCHTCRQEACRR